MPTEVVTTVNPDGGADFTDLAAAMAYREGDIVTRDTIEIFECARTTGDGFFGNGTATGVNWTTDADHYVVVRVAAASRHAGLFDTQVSRWGTWTWEIPHSRFEDILMRSHGTFVVNIAGSEADIRVDRCVIMGNNLAAAQEAVRLLLCPGTIQFRSCFFADADHCIEVPSTPAGNIHIKMYGNTVVASDACFLVNRSGISLTSDNNYYHGATQVISDSGGNGLTLGANDATSDASAPTVSLRSIAFDNTNFVNALADTRSADLHLAPGHSSNLLLGGANISGLTFDIEGDARPTGFFDIGGDQVSAAVTDDPDGAFPSYDFAMGGGALTRKPFLEIQNSLQVTRVAGTGTVQHIIVYREVPN